MNDVRRTNVARSANYSQRLNDPFLLVFRVGKSATQQYQVVLELFDCLIGQGLEEVDHAPVFR